MNNRMQWAAMLTIALVAVLLGVLGGWLVFEPLPAPLRGLGLMLIVLIPWVLTELTRERPPIRLKGRRR